MGAGAEAALLNTVIIGAVNVGATLIAVWLVDRVGRKALFLSGGLQMIAAEVVIGAILGTQFASAVLPDGSVGGVLAAGPTVAVVIFICL